MLVVQDEQGIPARLRRFDVAEWVGEGESPPAWWQRDVWMWRRIQAWQRFLAARREFAGERGLSYVDTFRPEWRRDAA